VAAFQRQAGESMPDPREMVVRLEARLRDNPNDLEGQVMAGRSYMVLDRLDEAARAWTKVLELDSRNGEAHFNIGVLLLTTRKVNDPQLFQQALDHFDIAYVKLPQEPALLWYRGIVYVHVGRFNDADESWTAAYQNLQPGSEDAEFVRKALEQLRAGTPPLF
jgi:cytochrome c-type biogenesis protein CcmH